VITYKLHCFKLRVLGVDMESPLALVRALFLTCGCLAACTLLGAEQALAQSSGAFFQKNGWTGKVLTKDRTALGCGVYADVTERVRFALVLDRNGTWRAVFDRPASGDRPAGFYKNLKWQMELLVDGTSIHRGTAVVDSLGIAVLEPPLSSASVRSLSLGHSLEVVTIRGRFQYNLAGSADAIEAAGQCLTALNSSSQMSTSSIEPRPQGPTSGTGFFVTYEGDILTNAHVVRGCVSVSAGMPGYQMQSVYVAARDHANDLALLKSNLRPSSVPTLRIGVRTGEGIALYGFPLAGLLPSTGNFTIGNVTATSGLRDDSRMLQISAPVQQGNSGGPVMDQGGGVVGIVVGKLSTALVVKEMGDIPQNVNFAIKTSVILNFLEANGVRSVNNSVATPSIAPADLADRAKLFAVFLICHR
jgi:serine protease Do